MPIRETIFISLLITSSADAFGFFDLSIISFRTGLDGALIGLGVEAVEAIRVNDLTFLGY
jgi:hypothetical protein